MQAKAHHTKAETNGLEPTEVSYLSSLTQNIQNNRTDTPKKHRRVLLVEDNIASLLVARSLLERLSCEVDVAETARAAFNFDKQSRYDIIFLDLDLPDLDGVSVCQSIRSKTGKNQFTPIIALSSRSAEQEKPACLAAGMNAYMEKPAFLAHFAQMMDLYILPQTTIS